MKHAGWALLIAAGLVAGALPQDKAQLQTALRDTEVKGDWIYDDIPAGYAQAKASGKPLLLTFR